MHSGKLLTRYKSQADDSNLPSGQQTGTFRMRFHETLVRWWVVQQLVCRTNGPSQQLTTAIGADAVESIFSTRLAERAFERTDDSERGVRWQVGIAAFTVRLEFEHRCLRFMTKSKRYHCRPGEDSRNLHTPSTRPASTQHIASIAADARIGSVCMHRGDCQHEQYSSKEALQFNSPETSLAGGYGSVCPARQPHR